MANATYFANHARRNRFPWVLYHAELGLRVKWAMRRTGSKPHPRVLVVGCGLEPFVTGVPDAEYHGCDIDVAAIEACRNAYPSQRERLALCPSPYELPAEETFEAPFDVIVAKEVIEHLADPQRWARVLAEHLAPGGALIVTTPNYGRWSTLPWIERTFLEWVARRDGYSRSAIHPSPFDRSRLSNLDLGPRVELVEVTATWTNWALVARFTKGPL